MGRLSRKCIFDIMVAILTSLIWQWSWEYVGDCLFLGDEREEGRQAEGAKGEQLQPDINL